MTVTREQIIEQLKTVMDPELHRDLVSLGMIKNIAVCNGHVSVTVELTTPACPMKSHIKQQVIQACQAIPGVEQVNVELTARPGSTQQTPCPGQRPLPGVRHIIAVGAGKGGVGKSTIAVNLAVGMARAGLKVGLLDADIYGPSAPTLLNLHAMTIEGTEDQLQPLQAAGIKVMTLGKLVPADRPLLWRGPMAHGTFLQLANNTQWGELDVLVIDLPPGTGDVPMSMSQSLKPDGALIVCTPQQVAQDDAVRAVNMFRSMNVPVLGVVENMSYFVGDDGKEYDLFGRGGAMNLATRLNLPFLGAIPINMALRANCDAGNPIANFNDNPPLAEQLEHLVNQCLQLVEICPSQAADQTTG